MFNNKNRNSYLKKIKDAFIEKINEDKDIFQISDNKGNKSYKTKRIKDKYYRIDADGTITDEAVAYMGADGKVKLYSTAPIAPIVSERTPIKEVTTSTEKKESPMKKK